MLEKTTKTNAKLRGKMQPFSRDQLQLIRATLKARQSTRDLALLNLSIDSMLRCGDLVRLKVDSVRDHAGGILSQFPVMQMKTSRLVDVSLTPKTRESLHALISTAGLWSDDYLFTADRAPHGHHLTEVSLRRIVKEWASIASLDPRRYSGHSLRRTKAVFIYRETKNIEALRQMLGHSTLAHTSAYLGVGKEEVSNLAMKFDI